MYRFWKSLTLPLLEAFKPNLVVEIGAKDGSNTKLLWNFCREQSSVLYVIDPAPSFSKEDICDMKETQKVILHKKLSLEVLPDIHNIDAALIDGDHNWYTVYNELKTLMDLSRQDKRPFPLVLLHDVSWPYARRDLYYNPETIPTEFRNEYDRKGIIPGNTDLSDMGFNRELCNSIREGGPKNGVLTAIEDFLSQSDETIYFYTISAYNGYGILISESRFNVNPDLKKKLTDLLPSKSVCTLFADMEKDRLDITHKLMIKSHDLANIKELISDNDRLVTLYRDELYSVYTSRSWRYTAPFRRIGSLICRVSKIVYWSPILAIIIRAYFLLPRRIRSSTVMEKLKNRFKNAEIKR